MRTILAATAVRQKIYFDMIKYVNASTKLWESQVWDFLIRTTSGEVCYTKVRTLIISEDTVRFNTASLLYNIGRVTFIKRDYRTGESDDIVITL